jgi:hypothetical protein
VQGSGCLGATLTDPLGATFASIFNTPGYNYIVWNDQLYGDPLPNLDSPWGHSKGMLAWNGAGDGMVLQVSTPSWPGSACSTYPRTSGNTLGAIGDDDDIEISQHFFALKLTHGDVVSVVDALVNASVLTDTLDPGIFRSSGQPADIDAIARTLGVPASEHGKPLPDPRPVNGPPACLVTTLSSGVRLISKPSALHVPPWQLVSGELGGLALRVASWWATPEIYTTVGGEEIDGWPSALPNPGAVEIATTGQWNGTELGLVGGDGAEFNHAKIGVTTEAGQAMSIFGDMNQQGALRADYDYSGQSMDSSQNGRGGTFYVVDNPSLHASITSLLQGDSAPRSRPTIPSTSIATAPSSDSFSI